MPEMPQVIALSGHSGVGKSTFAATLRQYHGFKTLSTRSELERIAGYGKLNRRSLIDLGHRLDEATAGKWIADAIASFLSRDPVARVCLDRLQKLQQREHFSHRPWRVTHVHLSSDLHTLKTRHAERQRDSVLEVIPFHELFAEERDDMEALRCAADVLVDAPWSAADIERVLSWTH